METTTYSKGAPSLEKRLRDPDTVEKLNRLLDRLDTIERAVGLSNDWNASSPWRSAPQPMSSTTN